MKRAAEPMRLYRHPLSGHCHRVELLLSLLGLPHSSIDVDLGAKEQKSAEFLAKNPFGQVPVLEDQGLLISDSNAILVYLALRYDEERRWLPEEPLSSAHVQRWLSVAAGELAQGPAMARWIRLMGAKQDATPAMQAAAGLFSVMESELSSREFLVGAQPTLADLALYSYTAHAPEGGISLEPQPAIQAWIARVEALPGFVPMQRAGDRVAS